MAGYPQKINFEVESLEIKPTVFSGNDLAKDE